MDNKYDSFAFKVKLNVAFEEEIKSFEQILPDPSNENELLCSEEIRMKMDKLNASKVISNNNYSFTWIFQNNFKDFFQRKVGLSAFVKTNRYRL